MPNLDFNFLPYSFNDSAVCQYYPRLKLEKKSGREITLILGNAASYAIQKRTLVAEKNEDAVSDKNKLAGINDRPQETAPVETAKNDRQEDTTFVSRPKFSGSITKPLNRTNYDLVKYELTRLDKYVDDLNATMSAVKKVSGDELAQFRTTISEFEIKAMERE
jgi:hypothetical protein